ncbi:MAG: glycosyltransferase [Cytophagaceae bacterium]|jgi:glycosyltransferase involved in cell wall biosynthesis|nr:glycosyltransferase [Cytophagaceae bacterium]
MGPLFSICIPTYNSGALVQYAIESALNQNFNDYEILIVDDCSSDTTFEEVTKFATYDKIRIVKNDINLGLTANWERCLHLANGKYISFLHPDDECEPTFLSSIYTILTENDSIGIVAVDNQNGKTNEIKSGLLSYNSFISTLFTFKYATAPSQCVFVKVY